ncbi:MAG: AAA family ATPase [Anaerolineae bacterium]|nr:AAA family ATPase [Anaerolineae bacterium]
MNESSQSPALHIQLLGDFRLIYDSTPVTSVSTARLQSLLAYLVLHRNAPQPRHHLAFLFWPDSTEAQAHTNLRNLLHLLRHALPDADRFLHADTQTLQWRADAPFTLDVADFESAVAQAERAEQAGDQAAIQKALEEAVTLYRGDLLPSCYDDWILPERERLSQAFIGALERLIRLLEDGRDYRAAIGYAQRLLRHDPLHEATCRRLMRLHALSGDRAGALRAYHTCATILQRELAVEPSPATREVYERLLQADVLPAPSPAPPAGLAAVSPLVGRHQEWARLQAAWQAASAGQPHFVLVAGEAGIGKTRLAEELVQWAGRQGIASASARCYAGEGGLAYAPVTTWLRARPLPPLEPIWRSEIARLLPELLVEQPDLSPPGPLAEAWQQQRFFEALTRAILGGSQPLLLLIDALQWCDRGTLEWLHYLLRFDPQARLLVVGTLRLEEMELDHPLATLLEALRLGDQLTEIELGPLNEAETLSLAAHLANRELDPALAAPLYQGSEGNPLFVVEMVRVGLAKGGPWTAEHGQEMARAALPPKVRMVIEARLAQLSPLARELAGLAATIGREFTFAVLARASDSDEDTLVRGLDELWRRRIVREQGADAYDFSHDKIREVAYATLSAARRRLLHRRVAQALEVVYADDLDPVRGQVAVHYERAGRPEQAIPYYQRAAEVARRVYANEEAMEYLERALALLEAEPLGEPRGDRRREVSAQLYEGLGDVSALIGRHDRAGDAYQHALGQGPHPDRIRQARLHRKRGNIWETQYRHEEAQRAFDLAETALGQEPAEADQEWWQEWAQIQTGRMWAHYWQGHMLEMLELAEKTRALAGRYGTPLQRIRFFFSLNLAGLRRDCCAVTEGTLGHPRTCLAANRESCILSQMVVAEFLLGFAHLWCGERDQAEEHLRASLELAERIGGMPWRCHCLTHLMDIGREHEQVEGIRYYVSRSLEAALALQMPEYIGAARANLAWLAWCERDLSQVQENGQSALALWQQTAYPFQWLALWPLIGVALVQDQISEAVDYARALLGPIQQRLPDPLRAALEDTIRAEEQGQPETARTHLNRAIELAQEMGYL